MIRINTQENKSSHYNNDLESGPGSRLLAGTGIFLLTIYFSLNFFEALNFFLGYLFSLISFIFLDFIFHEYFVG